MARSVSAAIAAIGAQLSQAAASVLLQVLAGKLLGVEGLGAYALVFGVVVMVTAVISGLVGDSLTVLDRSQPPVRAGLQRWLAGVAGATVVTLAPVAYIAGWLDASASVWMGVAGGAFVIEDTLRRLLMAVNRFWSIVVVDLSALVVSAGYVLSANALVGSVTLTTFLAGLALGQVAATAVAVAALPRAERWVASGARPDMGAVWRYGSWRALQQVLRPAMLTLVRVMVAVAVGQAALGGLEAARLYVAPALLMVVGVSSYLFASYARDGKASLRQLRHRADRAVLVLAGVALLLGALATLLAPRVGPLLLDDGEELNQLAAFGWACYAAATAAVAPYGSLAAVRRRQVGVLGIRLGESVLSVLLTVALLTADLTVNLVPLMLASASLLSGAVMRVTLLREDDGPGTVDSSSDLAAATPP